MESYQTLHLHIFTSTIRCLLSLGDYSAAAVNTNLCMVPNMHFLFSHIVNCIMADVKLFIIHIQLIFIDCVLEWDIDHLLIAALNN